MSPLVLFLWLFVEDRAPVENSVFRSFEFPPFPSPNLVAKDIAPMGGFVSNSVEGIDFEFIVLRRD